MSDDLHYPNQFIIGPAHLDLPGDWQKVEIRPSLRITAHSGLNVCQAVKDSHEVLMVGFIIDPMCPTASNQEIVEELAGLLPDERGFFQRCSACGGRWVIVYTSGSSYRLVCDATGLRQVFYTDRTFSDTLWIASQPRLLASLNGFRIDAEAVEFIDSDEFRSYTEFRFPGDRSPYKEVKHLLPNHWLDLSSGRCQRFWPDKPIPAVTVDQAVETTSSLLQGFMQGAVERFDLAVSLTAGLDSRVVLAASRAIRDKITVMTVRQVDKPERHTDVTVAAQVLSTVGMPHDVIRSSLLVDDDFLGSFKKNTTLPHYIYAADAQAILRRYCRKKVVAVGSVSEIGRLSFRAQLNKPETEAITSHDLAKLQKMGAQPFAVSAFDDWLQDLGNPHNIPVLDMFEWEQGHGCWLAMTQLEFDIAWRDLLAPFNCRDLLVTLLGVDQQHRCKPQYTLYRGIIQHLWPELLNVPINPQDKAPLNLGRMIRSRIPYPVKKIYRRTFKR
jgi:hypothetical protein